MKHTKCAYCRGPLPKDENGYDVPHHPGICKCGMPFRASWTAFDERGERYQREIAHGTA